MDLDKRKISFGLKPSYFFEEDLQNDEGSGSEPEEEDEDEEVDQDEEMRHPDSGADSMDEEVG